MPHKGAQGANTSSEEITLTETITAYSSHSNVKAKLQLYNNDT